MRLDKLSSPLLEMIRPAIEEIKTVVKTASLAGVSRPIKFYPLMVGNHLKDFKHGILVEVVRRSKRIELLAAGGRQLVPHHNLSFHSDMLVDMTT